MFVSISGDYAIVGEHRKNSAYIFHRTDINSWDAGVRFQGGAFFGAAVCLSGDYAIVGARNANTAYIYHRTGENTWDAGTVIAAPGGQGFGSSVAVDGDYAVVGASGGAGTAFVFQRTDVNSWGNATEIVAYDAAADDNFGFAASIYGDWIAMGAQGKDGITTGSGAVYIFRRTGSNTWEHEAKVLPSSPAQNGFGLSVSLFNDTLAVGSSHTENDVHFFRRNPDATWSLLLRVDSPVTEGIDSFGNSVSLSGSTAIVGDYTQDTLGTNSGAVYIIAIE
ncbi:MAG TPA: hypothetical protein PK668_18780 [Myxococcota bacterium]|nr:hypothetical protein [Myxococcota bacterium]HRY96598.1 hypothetical protein [Myxococcota bacterium]